MASLITRHGTSTIGTVGPLLLQFSVEQAVLYTVTLD